MVLLSDDIRFWSRQIQEHMGFIHDYTADLQLKDRAFELVQLWDEKSHGYEKSDVLPLMDETLEFQQGYEDILNDGEWTGMYSSWIEHMEDELKYAMDKAAEIDMSNEGEILFWADLIKDHTGLDARLLDPSEEILIDKATKISKIIKHDMLPHDKVYPGFTQQRMREVLQFHETVQNIKPKSVAQPKLVQHEINEERRGKYILSLIERR